MTLNGDGGGPAILRGSLDNDLFSFGQTAYKPGGQMASYIKGGVSQFSDKMQLSVHDKRIPPIGWSQEGIKKVHFFLIIS